MRCGCLICPKTFGTVRCVHCVKSAENKTEKPPDCSSDGFVLVGDERIELPQVESESTALPLCKSPSFGSCFAVRAAQRVLLYPQMRYLSSLFLKKVALFWQPTQQRKSFPHSNDTPAHRRTEESGPWAGGVYSGLLLQKAASAVSSAAGPGRYCRCFQWSGNSR